jgi:hypothetical protein
MMCKQGSSPTLYHPLRRTHNSQLVNIMKSICISAALAASALFNAQAQTFGEGMSTPSTEELTTILAGNTFTVDRVDGNHWRIEFKGNGYYFVNTNSGFSDSGEWKADSGKLCAQPKKGTAGCSDVRLHNGVLTLKRTNGEIVIYKRKE